MSSMGSSVSVGVGAVAVTVDVGVALKSRVAEASTTGVSLAGAGGEAKIAWAAGRPGVLVMVTINGSISRTKGPVGPQATKTREKLIKNRKNRYFKSFSLSRYWTTIEFKTTSPTCKHSSKAKADAISKTVPSGAE